jgi:hypothetical protein
VRHTSARCLADNPVNCVGITKTSFAWLPANTKAPLSCVTSRALWRRATPSR